MTVDSSHHHATYDGYGDHTNAATLTQRRAALARSLYLDQLRTTLVCGECAQHHTQCDCPASIKRSTPLQPRKHPS